MGEWHSGINPIKQSALLFTVESFIGSILPVHN
jgi:hypothetical protein